MISLFGIFNSLLPTKPTEKKYVLNICADFQDLAVLRAPLSDGCCICIVINIKRKKDEI